MHKSDDQSHRDKGLSCSCMVREAGRVDGRASERAIWTMVFRVLLSEHKSFPKNKSCHALSLSIAIALMPFDNRAVRDRYKRRYKRPLPRSLLRDRLLAFEVGQSEPGMLISYHSWPFGKGEGKALSFILGVAVTAKEGRKKRKKKRACRPVFLSNCQRVFHITEQNRRDTIDTYTRRTLY